MDVGAVIADSDFLLTENAVGPSAFDDPGDPAAGVPMALYGNIEGAVGLLILSRGSQREAVASRSARKWTDSPCRA